MRNSEPASVRNPQSQSEPLRNRNPELESDETKFKQRENEHFMLTKPTLPDHADAIRQISKRSIEDAVEIGRRLTECKSMLVHGHFGDWIRREFSWSERTAQRFMRLYELSVKTDNLSDLALPVSALYLLAARSTPEIACTEIIKAAKQELAAAKDGDPTSIVTIKDAVAKLRKALKPPAPPSEPREPMEQFRDYRRAGHPITRHCWMFLATLRDSAEVIKCI